MVGSVRNVSMNMYAKFRYTLLHVKKALGIFREVIPRARRRTRTTKVAFSDPPSRSKKSVNIRQSYKRKQSETQCNAIQPTFSALAMSQNFWVSVLRPATHEPAKELLEQRRGLRHEQRNSTRMSNTHRHT